MSQLKLLDLFCGAGGCSVGYSRAGFDVTGVDVAAKTGKRYPFEFVHADALEVLADRAYLDTFDAIHASPPCQLYSITNNTHKKAHPDLLPPVHAALIAWGGPWVIENVPGALVLCGSEFGLEAWDGDRRVTLRRHRLFMSNIDLMGAGGCMCAEDRAKGRIAGVYGNGATSVERARARAGGYTPPSVEVRKRLMGINWMLRDELSQAIPPAYTEFIGEQLLAHLSELSREVP